MNSNYCQNMQIYIKLLLFQSKVFVLTVLVMGSSIQKNSNGDKEEHIEALEQTVGASLNVSVSNGNREHRIKSGNYRPEDYGILEKHNNQNLWNSFSASQNVSATRIINVDNIFVSMTSELILTNLSNSNHHLHVENGEKRAKTQKDVSESDKEREHAIKYGVYRSEVIGIPEKHNTPTLLNSHFRQNISATSVIPSIHVLSTYLPDSNFSINLEKLVTDRTSNLGHRMNISKLPSIEPKKFTKSEISFKTNEAENNTGSSDTVLSIDIQSSIISQKFAISLNFPNISSTVFDLVEVSSPISPSFTLSSRGSLAMFEVTSPLHSIQLQSVEIRNNHREKGQKPEKKVIDLTSNGGEVSGFKYGIKTSFTHLLKPTPVKVIVPTKNLPRSDGFLTEFSKSENQSTILIFNSVNLSSIAASENSVTVTPTLRPNSTTNVINVEPTDRKSFLAAPTTSTAEHSNIHSLNIFIPKPTEPYDMHEPEEHPSSYILVRLNSSLVYFCRHHDDFRAGVSELMSHSSSMNIDRDRVVIFNMKKCKDKVRSKKLKISVLFFISEKGSGKCEKFITRTCAEVLKSQISVFPGLFHSKIIEVQEYCQKPCISLSAILDPSNKSKTSPKTIIAVSTLSAIVTVSFILVLVLLFILRNRQKLKAKKISRGQPFDGHSLDSISFKSFRSSLRSKRFHRRRRSYLNFAFNDPDAPSQLLNVSALTSYACNEDILKNQFETIPMIIPRYNEMPPGVEPKNRYSNGIPIPETRVSLSFKPNVPNSDYINANFVRGYRDEINTYIACQAPLESTIEDFWRMIWEQKASVIVMLTLLEEGGIEKCAEYFPHTNTLDCHRSFNSFRISLIRRDVREKFVISTFQLRNIENNLMREVLHYWYTDWPTVGVPEYTFGIISFLEECQMSIRTNPGSTIVHCSGGTGRTGVFVCLDICMQQLMETRFIDVLNCVYKLRHDRNGLVKTKEQYIFIYKVLMDFAEKTSVPSKRTSLKSEV